MKVGKGVDRGGGFLLLYNRFSIRNTCLEIARETADERRKVCVESKNNWVGFFFSKTLYVYMICNMRGSGADEKQVAEYQ